MPYKAIFGVIEWTILPNPLRLTITLLSRGGGSFITKEKGISLAELSLGSCRVVLKPYRY